MIDLKYNSTYKFSTQDIFDYSDTPITFVSKSYLPPEWAKLCRTWVNDGHEDIERALELVGMSIVAVEQDGQSWPVAGRKGAEDLRDGIEAASPGQGEEFIKRLALRHWDLHFSRAELELGNSRAPLPQSENGNGQRQEKLPVKKSK